MHPLGDGVPVTVACRVLKLARQPYYRWLGQPVTDAMLKEAYRENALFDAYRDDPCSVTASWPTKRAASGP